MRARACVCVCVCARAIVYGIEQRSLNLFVKNKVEMLLRTDIIKYKVTKIFRSFKNEIILVYLE
jgi:hypothetical protein